MPLVSGAEVVLAAAKAGRGVGAFNVIQLEHATALIAGAEQAGAPVILQISENAVKYHGALKPIGVATLAAAAAASVPVVVHLDHAMDRDLVTEAVSLGFTSVMYDASKLEYADNVAATSEVTTFCHDHGVFVEAEIGEVGGKDGVHAPGARTRPDEAVAFAEATGVDALAVAVGSSHAMTERTATLDFELITELHAAVAVPLVLHGSSGVADPDLTRAVEAGHDQGQHRHPPQQRLHRFGPPDPRRQPDRRRHPQVPGPGSRRGRHRGRPPAGPAQGGLKRGAAAHPMRAQLVSRGLHLRTRRRIGHFEVLDQPGERQLQRRDESVLLGELGLGHLAEAGGECGQSGSFVAGEPERDLGSAVHVFPPALGTVMVPCNDSVAQHARVRSRSG